MADKKTKETLLKIYVGLLTSISAVAVVKYYLEDHGIETTTYVSFDDQPLIGKNIQLDEGTLAYSNITDAINKTNGQTAYYDEKYERQVITAFYQFEGEIIRVDMKDDYNEKEQKIINGDGKIVGVITTIDLENKLPEAFYNASDIKLLKYVKNIKKTNITKFR